MQIRNSVQQVRKTRGLAAAELAARIGTSRQTVYAIEDGSFVPNTAIALRLARALDSSVEELFSLENQGGTERLEAEALLGNSGAREESRFVKLCPVKKRLIAVPVSPARVYLPLADGVIAARAGRKLSVETTSEGQGARARLLLAGCDPALSLLAGVLEGSGIDLVTVPCSSRRALDWLQQGRVHAAGLHLRDPGSGEFNVPIVKNSFRAGEVRIVTFAVWQQGLIVRAGNPKRIQAIADLVRKDVRIVNREKGSGSRDLLDKELKKAKIKADTITGYGKLADGHLPAAFEVAAGFADCCVATESAARFYGLDFVPLEIQRFDLTFPYETLELPGAKALLDTLQRASLRRKLHCLAGYDTAHTGEVVM